MFVPWTIDTCSVNFHYRGLSLFAKDISKTKYYKAYNMQWCRKQIENGGWGGGVRLIKIRDKAQKKGRWLCLSIITLQKKDAYDIQ